MSHSGNIECSLANLPSDIIRKIIESGHEEFDNMRMISYRWNSHALELYENHDKLPVIKSIEWNCDSKGSRKLHIYVPRRYVNYFGIQEWKVLENFEDKILAEWTFAGSNWETEYRFSRQMPSFKRLFNRCSRIERLQLKYSRISNKEKEMDVLNRTMDEAMRTALGNVLIDEIEFYTGGVYTIAPNIFLHFARIHQSRKLVLVTEFWGLIDQLQQEASSSFYEDAFNQVSTIEIVYIYNGPHNPDKILLPAYRKIEREGRIRNKWTTAVEERADWKRELVWLSWRSCFRITMTRQ